MRQGLYNFRNTIVREIRSLDSQNDQGSSSVQRDIQFSHTDTEETFFEQDSSMGDRDDRNTSPDQENVMFRLLNTFQEQNRRMDMMLQLMARQMDVNINLGDVINGNNNYRGNDNGG